ncbi:dihydrofolate reductase [Billgrantia endophytica]|uniref:Dihydrofolate reductase n=1 Tax=Billgrantia endophytica TaxID=2033802 RepID=A0A2N7TXT5_9GAMM|nr:dihydrofolate reductase [Halomonas endophytica]PMR72997.1 diacylglycerol kinase [Halomonas endophytica]
MTDETLIPVAMIAALSRNRVIGVGNKLPWYLPEDLKFFKRMTQAKPLIMGRKTFESIGRPLPGRLNIVVTRDTAFRHDGVRVCHDLESALALADQQATIDAADEIMVMGGGEIYAQALPHASRLYLTEVEIDVEGDTRFPALDPAEWKEVRRLPGEPAAGQPSYSFVEYRRGQP